MDQREIAQEAARLQAELSELGDETPALQQRIEGLGRSIEQLRHDLRVMRAGPGSQSHPVTLLSPDGAANLDPHGE